MMNKTELFQAIRKQAQKVFPSTAKVNQKDKNNSASAVGFVVEGQAKERHLWDTEYRDLHQLFRHQFPSVTKQLLGSRYNTVNKISNFVLPNGMDQAADEMLELLADFASYWGSTESVLVATGCKQINQLTNDAARSQRAGSALKEVNKAIAALQGAVSGMTGLLGAAIDLPASVIFSLKTIYEIGHSYGFELDTVEDQKAVYFALSTMDLGLIAEKQALLLVLRRLKGMMVTGDISQIQSFLNSNYSVEQFNHYLLDENGQYKWSGFNILAKAKVLRFAAPVVGGAVGAFYNVKLIEEVALKADIFFANARLYYKENPESSLEILAAYHAQKNQLLVQKNELLEVSTVSTQVAQPIEEGVVETQVDVKSIREKNERVDDEQLTSKSAHESVLVAEQQNQLKTESSSAATITETNNEEDLTKDLVKLVQVHMAKVKQPIDEFSIEVEKNVTSKDEAQPVVKANRSRKSTATTPRKAPVSRSRKKPTDQNNNSND